MAGIVTITLPFGGLFTISPQPVSQGTNPIAVNSGIGVNTSYNWSGYQSTGGTYTSITGTWTIPSVPSASSTEADATWIGIGGVSSNDLIQAGTQAVINGSGAPTYQAWYEVLPQVTQQVPLTVSPGDSITATLLEIAPASGNMPEQWSVAIRDNTTGQSYQTTLSYNSSLSSAEWIEEMPSDGQNFVPLDNFSSVSFTNGMTTENGNYVSIAGANAQQISMYNRSGQALATPSALDTDGESFIVTRTSASASASAIGFGGLGRGWRRTGVGVEGFGPRPTSTPGGGFGYGRGGFGQFYRIMQEFQQLQQEVQVRQGWERIR